VFVGTLPLPLAAAVQAHSRLCLAAERYVGMPTKLSRVMLPVCRLAGPSLVLVMVMTTKGPARELWQSGHCCSCHLRVEGFEMCDVLVVCWGALKLLLNHLLLEAFDGIGRFALKTGSTAA
jgi:hypothetical protein